MTTQIIKTTSNSGKVSYQYFVDGKKVRTSPRLYVASTINGEFFFGRHSLIGKGVYKTMLNNAISAQNRGYIEEKIIVEENLKRYQRDYNFYHSEKGLAHCRRIVLSFVTHELTQEEIDEREQEALHDWEDMKKKTAKWLEDAKKKATPEAIQNSLDDIHAWAEQRIKSLQIVHYDLENIIEK